MLYWHLDRYDRLRSSTTGRASVVLSAGAILFAGNAIILSALLQQAVDEFPRWWSAAFTVATLACSALVILSLVRAADVLVTAQDSRTLLNRNDSIPSGLVFNGSDTVREIATFGRFQEVLEEQTPAQIVEAAQVELWIGIRQHRLRYERLRLAVRLLRWAAVAFATTLGGALLVDLTHEFL